MQPFPLLLHRLAAAFVFAFALSSGQARAGVVMLPDPNALPPIVIPVGITSVVIDPEICAPEKTPDGFIIPTRDGGFTKIQVCAEDIIRVVHAADRSYFSRQSLAVAPAARSDAPPVPWELKTDHFFATVKTGKVWAQVQLRTGEVLLQGAGGAYLSEQKGGRVLQPAIVQGEQTFHVRQSWFSTGSYTLYGLGQHQLGLMNLKGYDLDLWQHNGTIAVPFLVSGEGYGILWDNTSFTRFGDLREPQPILPAMLFDAEGNPGGLTASYFADDHFGRRVAKRVDSAINIALAGGEKEPNKLIHPDLPPRGNVSVRWEGEFMAERSGSYLFQTFSNNSIQLWVDDKLVISHWRQGWLPWNNVAKVYLSDGKRHRIKLEWAKEQGMETVRLLWKTPSPETGVSLWSEVGEGTDYYFIHGPQMDKVIAGYRRLTGAAPMPPRWAFGLWQCRQRYKTAQESLDVLEGYRSRGIPLDNIVQDWLYWKEDAWGSHEFDPARFPDPAGWIRAIHEKYHAQLMISVWPKFYAGTKNFEALRGRGFLYEPNLGEDFKDWLGHPTAFYDAFNPAAREMFWSQINRELFSKGVDAWWMDASEPDLTATPTLQGQRTHVHPTALGTGARMLNAYPLVNSQAIYEGQRAAAPDQRVFLLTRSGFTGQQRYAGAVWSGDISSTWTAMRQQISAGIGFCLSGLPYWTMDAGGFSVPARFSRKNAKPEDVEEWRELNTRWFEFAAFAPLMRVHGESPNREMWEFGGEGSEHYKAQLKFDRLRYRLLPYIYSLAGQVTHEGGTMMRALIMDFPHEGAVEDIGDQYMFGPAFLVSPVTAYQARSRPVWLPDQWDDNGNPRARWYDFWTGAAAVAKSDFLDAPAPLDAMPLHVRMGSIIPMGPELQYASEKPADPTTLWVYAGVDGAFTLYEDDGVSYQYEKGASSRIALRWDEAAQTLTIGKREGEFAGMLKERTFQVVLVSKDKPVEFSFEPKLDRVVKYDGEAQVISFK